MKRDILILTASLLLLTALFLLRLLFHPQPPPKPDLVRVVIREGLSIPQISELLLQAGVLSGESLSTDLEGYLFPDTYEFFAGSKAVAVARRMGENFDTKALPSFAKAVEDRSSILPSRNLNDIIKVASLIEKEVPGSDDRRIVAGIIWKRLRNRFPIQVDSAICYVKPEPCYPVTKDDFAVDSPYNTYMYKGLPPTPISNPGLDAIIAAMSPKESPYWFYLTEPKKGRTIFSIDLDEHNKNVYRYLKR